MELYLPIIIFALVSVSGFLWGWCVIRRFRQRIKEEKKNYKY